MADKTTIVVHDGDMDKLFSALIIANGSMAMGMEATLYFTFWGLLRLKKKGLTKGSLSKWHLMGLGKMLVESRMRKARVASLERMMADFKELGGRIIDCEMTMEIMGIKKSDLREELIDEYGAVGTYVADAREANITLMI